jgi:hypothetical protein
VGGSQLSDSLPSSLQRRRRILHFELPIPTRPRHPQVISRELRKTDFCIGKMAAPELESDSYDVIVVGTGVAESIAAA